MKAYSALQLVSPWEIEAPIERHDLIRDVPSWEAPHIGEVVGMEIVQ